MERRRQQMMDKRNMGNDDVMIKTDNYPSLMTDTQR